MESSANIRLAVVDDQNLFRESLIALIGSEPDLEHVAEAGDGASFLALCATLPALPDIVLMDMNMPGLNGVELNEALQRQYPSVKVIVLSVHAQERLMAKMITAGAVGYLAKNCNKDELLLAIRAVYRTGFYMSPQVLRAIRQTHSYRPTSGSLLPGEAELTNREKEVLHLICQQYSNAEIAEKLFLSVRTVEGHRNNLLLKTGCRNTAGLVLFAVKNQLHEVLF
ncbi:response regulator transcription factor [Hymenobacter metallicola]|uniref:Response regulator transcription factor n=1 Tax=Hymenobacter metallicola TaxID=2563114 RepID=A0A4Z0QE82_9BACT|nr:response regulator transcription factor [Hymenobacter metallicola]TGE28370.1 response regulator transcription factor [Hymenobacter metallicola]